MSARPAISQVPPALALLDPGAWVGAREGPIAPRVVELLETHISWVLRGERDVIKLKKPVSLGFLDFRTLEAREAACRAEVDLNRRLAPDVYRGVLPVFRRLDGSCSLEPGGAVVDWAVWMRRLPDEASFEHIAAAGDLGVADVDRLAAHLARFHARCDRTREIDAFGRADVIARNVHENFEQTRGALERYLTQDEARELEAWQLAEVARLEPTFDLRVAHGRVRDGHGDLRLEHVYREGDALTILDCIEFADRFRFGDVCSDLAFLSMDLAWHGRVDLAERLFASYAREADDHDLYAVADFYESYRAFVRGKIASFIASDPDASDAVRQRAGRDARRFFLLALSGPRRALVGPTLTAVGGLIASGKSTVAELVGERIGAPVIDADRTRKHMLGVDVQARVAEAAFQGAYDPGFTDRVYAEVLRRAAVVLASGRSVVVDASFRSRQNRARARALAERAGVPFLFVECAAPPDVLRARLERRAATGDTVSDGREAIFDAFVASFERVVELPHAQHVVWNTAHPHPEVEWAEHFPRWPRSC